MRQKIESIPKKNQNCTTKHIQMTEKVLILGNPKLRVISKKVEENEFGSEILNKDIEELKSTLQDFRKKMGFGRGIAAIQIGIVRRMIALNLGKNPFVIMNPKIIQKSEETFTMWDDCMSFPHLLVRVQRNKSISIEYDDENGKRIKWEGIDQATSELLQHEMDHLDAVLAVDRAIDNGKDIIYKQEYEKNKQHYDNFVDYVIQPTL